jgi:pyridoxal phosphate enzyme (YggS family)
VIGVTENLRKIRDLLDKAAVDAGRRPEDVHLLAVSKKQSLDKVVEAAAAGQSDFGENTVQEGIDKVTKLAEKGLAMTPPEGLCWHFIGHLQSNKTRIVAEHFDWVHTIDKLKTAKRLSEQRPESLGDLQVCIQVNIDDEAAKTGVAGSDVLDLAHEVAALPRLKLRGLMCLPAIRESFDEQRMPFAQLREHAQMLRQQGLEIDTLSMGMTSDYRAAIFEGATIVRIGTAVFGPRES